MLRLRIRDHSTEKFSGQEDVEGWERGVSPRIRRTAKRAICTSRWVCCSWRNISILQQDSLRSRFLRMGEEVLARSILHIRCFLLFLADRAAQIWPRSARILRLNPAACDSIMSDLGYWKKLVSIVLSGHLKMLIPHWFCKGVSHPMSYAQHRHSPANPCTT